MSKPKFYQAILVPVEDVLAKVYPENVKKYGSPMVTMAERMGTSEAKCPDCGHNEWWLQPKEGAAVREGGKPYIECLNCGYQTHL
jgi:predicted RNA-binding Zn-ribbon protein involved in translation (DUF1610 family)